jgi:hypothetical protein
MTKITLAEVPYFQESNHHTQLQARVLSELISIQS